MKTVTRTTQASRKLAWATCLTVALGTLGAGAAVTTVVNETFDPPKIALTAADKLFNKGL